MANYNYIYIYIYNTYNIIAEKPAVTEPLPTCHFDFASNIYVAIPWAV